MRIQLFPFKRSVPNTPARWDKKSLSYCLHKLSFHTKLYQTRKCYNLAKLLLNSFYVTLYEMTTHVKYYISTTIMSCKAGLKHNRWANSRTHVLILPFRFCWEHSSPFSSSILARKY